MAILAECDICGSQHRVKDGLVGQFIQCKDCGVQFIVPDDNLITPETFVEEGGRLRRREPVPAPSLWPRLIAGLVTVLVTVILIVVVWTLVKLVRPVTKNQAKAGVGSPWVRCGQTEIANSRNVQER